jgi:hypothetical protein
MRHAVAFAAASLVLAMSLPAAAQDFKLRADLFGQKKPAPKPPKVDWNWKPLAQTQASRPSVVCGMTVVPADPAIDPKIRVAPRDNGVKFAMKVVEPTICQAPSQR